LKRLARYVSIAFASLVVSTAHAANTDPFDFDYEIIGANADRPDMVFNDGSNTYIQHRPGQEVSAPGAHAEGPYLVISGTPDHFEFLSNGHSVTARWKSANSFIGGNGVADAVRGDQPVGFTGFSDRLALIGQHPDIGVVRAVSSTMPVGALVKALAPQGWSGTASKDIDLTAPVAFSTTDGESWLQALNRLMSATNLYASVDFTSERIRLDRQAPKSEVDTFSGIPTPQPVPVAAVPPQTEAASRLASWFNATGIRDSDDTHIQMRFGQKPKANLKFETTDGSSLHPTWSGDTPVVTFDRAQAFIVTDGITKVMIDRDVVTVYDFPRDNAAHLQDVFDANGRTYFKFAPNVIKVSVVNAKGAEGGEQRGSNYMYRGIEDSFKAEGDGVQVYVKRRLVTHFSEKDAS
jgi:hypothetical protein